MNYFLLKTTSLRFHKLPAILHESKNEHLKKGDFMSKKILLAISLMLVTATAFGLSRQEARVAKERLTRCQYNDSVCTANVLIDAMVAAGNNQNDNRPPVYQRQKAVTVFQYANCTGNIQKTVIIKHGKLDEAIHNCSVDVGSNVYGSSYAIDGECREKNSYALASSLCTTASIKANTMF